MVLDLWSAQQKILAQLEHEVGGLSTLVQTVQNEFEGRGAVVPHRMGELYESELRSQQKAQLASGSFYTPEYLVDFVVQKTLDPLVNAGGREVSVDEISQLRILDFSCGCGAFLLGVVRYLEDYCVRAGAVPGSELREHICQHCLIGVDLDPRAIALTRASLRLAASGPNSWKLPLQLTVGDALLPETDVGPINAIVGNPPWGQKKISLAEEKRNRYKQLYSTAVGPWDPFKLFVERCHQLLDCGRRWGLVLPDVLLLKNVQVVRDLILAQSAMDVIAHCGRAFAGVNMDVVAVIATRRNLAKTSSHTLRVWPHLPTSWHTKFVPTHRQEQNVFWEFCGHKFNLYLHGPALDFYRRLRPFRRLGNFFEMHEGVHTGNSRKTLFLTVSLHSMCRKVIVGRKEFSAYRLAWGGTWLDTSDSAIDREAGGYGNLGQPRWHECEKIVVRRTGDRVVAAYDPNGVYVSNNFFVLNSKIEGTVRWRKAVVALLNSRFMTWYFRATQPRKGRLFAELKLVHLRDFPMPSAKHWERIEERLAALSDQASVDGAGEEIAEEVDVLVEDAFEISQEERSIIDRSM